MRVAEDPHVTRLVDLQRGRPALSPPERGVLHNRIAARFDAMLDAGFLDEVRALRALPGLAAHPQPLDLPALRAVGYRQAWEYLQGDGDMATFRERAIAAWPTAWQGQNQPSNWP